MRGFFSVAVLVMISFAAGYGVSWFGINNIGASVKQGASAVVDAAEQQRYDSCAAKFNQDTQCLAKEKQDICAKQLAVECGSNPAIPVPPVKGKR